MDQEQPVSSYAKSQRRFTDPVIYRCEHLIAILESLGALRPEDQPRNSRFIELIRDLRARMLHEDLELGAESEHQEMLFDTLDCLSQELTCRQEELATWMKKTYFFS